MFKPTQPPDSVRRQVRATSTTCIMGCTVLIATKTYVVI